MNTAVYKKIALVLVFIALIVTLRNYGITEYCSFAYVKSNLYDIQRYIEGHYWKSVALFIAALFTMTTTSMPGASFFLIASGLFFGIGWGVLYSVIAATLGAMVLFLIARYVLGEWVQRRYAARLVSFNQEINRYGQYYLLGVRSITIIPFSLITIFSGITTLPLITFLWATALGMIPSTIIFAFIGQQLCKIGCFDSFLCPPIIMALVILGLFKVGVFVASYFFYRARKKQA